MADHEAGLGTQLALDALCALQQLPSDIGGPLAGGRILRRGKGGAGYLEVHKVPVNVHRALPAASTAIGVPEFRLVDKENLISEADLRVLAATGWATQSRSKMAL
ncbi:MAG: hypothetical protein WBM14_05025 [Terracidiphilus sp.]